MLPCFKEKAIAQLLDFNKYTKKKNRQTHPSLSIFLFIFTCVVVAFCPVNPLNFLLHFYAIGVWIRSENRWVLFCPVFYKSQCFQALAAFITEAEILMKPARIRRYLISRRFLFSVGSFSHWPKYYIRFTGNLQGQRPAISTRHRRFFILTPFSP